MNPFQTTAQLASAFDSFIKDDVLKENFIGENYPASFCALFGLNQSTVHLELDIKKDSISESFLSKKIFDFFNNHGFSCELVDKSKPHWEVFNFVKDGKKFGKFNSDIYPKSNRDVLFVTITPDS